MSTLLKKIKEREEAFDDKVSVFFHDQDIASLQEWDRVIAPFLLNTKSHIKQTIVEVLGEAMNEVAEYLKSHATATDGDTLYSKFSLKDLSHLASSKQDGVIDK